MTAKREAIGYQRSKSAVIGLLQCILNRSRMSQSALEAILGIAPSAGSNFGRYLRGDRVLPEWRFLQIVRVARNEGWLTQDDLKEMGLEDAATNTDRATSIRKNRRIAANRFFEGQLRMVNGLLPIPVYGKLGKEIRPPRDEAEMAQAYAEWVAGIEQLGGQITTGSWVPAWHSDWIAEQNSREVEGISDWDLEQFRVSQEEAPAVDAGAFSARPQPYAATPVRNLRLWFGGREWSRSQPDWSPFQHALGDWWSETTGDDLGQFVHERQQQRDGARQLMLAVLAHTASPDWRKSGAPASKVIQSSKRPPNAKAL